MGERPRHALPKFNSNPYHCLPRDHHLKAFHWLPGRRLQLTTHHRWRWYHQKTHQDRYNSWCNQAPHRLRFAGTQEVRFKQLCNTGSRQRFNRKMAISINLAYWSMFMDLCRVCTPVNFWNRDSPAFVTSWTEHTGLVLSGYWYHHPHGWDI